MIIFNYVKKYDNVFHSSNARCSFVSLPKLALREQNVRFFYVVLIKKCFNPVILSVTLKINEKMSSICSFDLSTRRKLICSVQECLLRGIENCGVLQFPEKIKQATRAFDY